MSRFRPRLTYSNVVASIALFAVLGGGAYASIDRKIRTGDLQNRLITTKKVKKQAVKAQLLAQNSVRPGKMIAGAVRTGKIFDGAVIADKIGDGAVETDKIAGGAVETDKIAGGAVDGGKIASGAVDGGKIADGAVQEQKLANGSVSKSKLANTYLEAVAGGPTTVNVGNVPAQQCVLGTLSTTVAAQNGDIVTVTPRPGVLLNEFPGNLSTSGARTIAFITPSRPAVRVCNVTGADINPGSRTYDWELLRR